MARPRKFYVHFELGNATIIEGSQAARRVYALRGFPTRLQAEEYAAWWCYTHVPWHLTGTTARTPESPRLSIGCS